MELKSWDEWIKFDFLLQKKILISNGAHWSAQILELVDHRSLEEGFSFGWLHCFKHVFFILKINT